MIALISLPVGHVVAIIIYVVSSNYYISIYYYVTLNVHSKQIHP